MPQFFRNHIIVTNRTETLPYTSNQSGRTKVMPRAGLNRSTHGNHVRNEFDAAVQGFSNRQDEEFVYLVFKSPLDYFLDIDKLDKGNFRLASYKELETQDQEGTVHRYYEAAVYLNRRAISQFLNKIEAYLSPAKDTPLTYNEDGTVKGGGNPRNLTLIANIDEIRAATLESFWQEPEIPFPQPNQSVWWEIWMHREEFDSSEALLALNSGTFTEQELVIGKRVLIFPEHFVFLVRGTSQQLAQTILYTDRLAEIRKPKETADFFLYQERGDQSQWIYDLVSRVDNNQANSHISICLLDTGVTTENPLLVNLIPDKNLEAIEPAWSTADTYGGNVGHGTPMAGLALYGDLVDVFDSNDRVIVNHHLESIKLLEQSQPNDSALYGAVTQEALARAEIINPDHKRVACMAVTGENENHKGRPSSWSSAIDQSLFGTVEEPNDKTLFFVSGGNMDFAERINYPLSNEDCSVHDPAQSFNSITVGAYTLKDQIDLTRFPSAVLLAQRGGMAPCNSTSLCWVNEWCRKPDIVMEGGNLAIQNGGTIDPDSLAVLSTARGRLGQSWLSGFGDTSGATALASRFAAELYFHYPDLWPETIRGLIVHSATWTPSMLGNRQITQLSATEKEKLIKTVGFGVPNMEKARYSANNSLSIIAQRSIKPFKLEGSVIKTDSFHLFDLPWPTEALRELHDTQVKFKITVSYFIEPNPGNKQYDLAASYRSHGLRFKMIDSSEGIDAFKARVSKAMRDGEYEREGSEHWVLGGPLRDKGSIHQDIWVGTAVDLASRNKIAIYPVGGWWKTRKKHIRYENTVRYSLIMTIETPDIETDIYTPVQNLISVEL